MAPHCLPTRVPSQPKLLPAQEKLKLGKMAPAASGRGRSTCTPPSEDPSFSCTCLLDGRGVLRLTPSGAPSELPHSMSECRCTSSRNNSHSLTLDDPHTQESKDTTMDWRVLGKGLPHPPRQLTAEGDSRKYIHWDGKGRGWVT